MLVCSEKQQKYFSEMLKGPKVSSGCTFIIVFLLYMRANLVNLILDS